MKLSIIIVNWNTREYLRKCLTAIFNQKLSCDTEVIIVDNASSDGSVAMIKRLFPQVIVQENRDNRGFATANNQALKLAQGEYVLLLNTDTKLLNDALREAVKYLDDNVRVGALAPKILNADGSTQHPCYLTYPNILSELAEALFITRYIKFVTLYGFCVPASKRPQEIAHSTGAAMFIRRAVVEKIGKLDEKFVFSYEDTDYCRRIRETGYQIVYFPKSEVVHYGGKSKIKLDDHGADMVLTSKYYYYKKYYYRLGAIILMLILMLGAVNRICFYSLSRALINKPASKMIIQDNLAVLKWIWSKVGTIIK